MSAIELDGLGVRLGSRTVLEGVDLHCDARTLAVIGDNGSGKSTLARVLAGLIPATSGRARVLGLDVGRDASALRTKVAVVFSDPDAQIVMPTVSEDVAFSLRSLRRGPSPAPGPAPRHPTPATDPATGPATPATDPATPATGPRDHAYARFLRRFAYIRVISRQGGGVRDDEKSRVADVLERFGLDAIADQPSHELSGGQKQLLALAGAFVRAPELVIADEPTAALDARNARRVADHLFGDGSHRLVLVTHDLTLAARCEQAVHVSDGSLVAAGPADEVIAGYERALAC